MAPNRLSYQIERGGSAIIIGARRWDRFTPRARWRVTTRYPVTQPLPPWIDVEDAYLLGSTTLAGRAGWHISFFDPATPGWFSILVDKANYRTLETHMVAAAHFMDDLYGPFNATIAIVAPSGVR